MKYLYCDKRCTSKHKCKVLAKSKQEHDERNNQMRNVSTKDVLVFMRKQAHKVATDSAEALLSDSAEALLSDSAEALLSDVQSMVNELKRGKAPISGLNAYNYQRYVNDHAKLRQLEEVLELSEYKESK